MTGRLQGSEGQEIGGDTKTTRCQGKLYEQGCKSDWVPGVPLVPSQNPEIVATKSRRWMRVECDPWSHDLFSCWTYWGDPTTGVNGGSKE